MEDTIMEAMETTVEEVTETVAPIEESAQEIYDNLVNEAMDKLPDLTYVEEGEALYVTDPSYVEWLKEKDASEDISEAVAEVTETAGPNKWAVGLGTAAVAGVAAGAIVFFKKRRDKKKKEAEEAQKKEAEEAQKMLEEAKQKAMENIADGPVIIMNGSEEN